MIVRMIAIENTGDCDHVSFALPPSSPGAMVASLVCRTDTDCANITAGYMPPRQLLLVTKMTNQITIDNQWTMLCSGMDPADTSELFLKTLYYTCGERKTDSKYTDLKQIDFVFRGMILYYPLTAATMDIASRMPKYLDGIEDLKVGALLANSSNVGRIATIANLLGQISSCYQPLEPRIMGFSDRASALNYAQQLNITTNITWGIIGWENVGNDFTYSITPQYQMRRTVSTLYLQALAEVAIIDYLSGGAVSDLPNLETKFLPSRSVLPHSIPFCILSDAIV